MKNKISLLFLLFALMIGVVIAQAPSQLPQQQPYNCINETLPLEIKLIEINKTLNATSENLNYYQNLSDYYKYLYESKEVNITHGELIQIVNNMNTLNFNLNQTNENITKLGDKFSLFTIEVGFSILGVSAIGSFIGVSLIEWVRRKRKGGGVKHEQKSNPN